LSFRFYIQHFRWPTHALGGKVFLICDLKVLYICFLIPFGIVYLLNRYLWNKIMLTLNWKGYSEGLLSNGNTKQKLLGKNVSPSSFFSYKNTLNLTAHAQHLLIHQFSLAHLGSFIVRAKSMPFSKEDSPSRSFSLRFLCIGYTLYN